MQPVITTRSTITLVVLAFFIFVLGIQYLRRIEDSYQFQECSIEVLPLGIQIVSSSHHFHYDSSVRFSNVKRIFIAKEDIVDVIINEVVLSFKVLSQVCFRVKHRIKSVNCTEISKNVAHKKNKYSKYMNNERLIASMAKTGDMKLVPAFTNFNLSYTECEQLWIGLMKALNKV